MHIKRWGFVLLFLIILRIYICKGDEYFIRKNVSHAGEFVLVGFYPPPLNSSVIS